MKEYVDVIIPVYNTPIADLKRCLNSIQNQTYKQWQIRHHRMLLEIHILDVF